MTRQPMHQDTGARRLAGWLGSAVGLVVLAVVALALLQTKPTAGAGPSAAPSTEVPATASAEPTDVIVKSPDPNATPPAEFSPEPTAVATPLANVPPELAAALAAAHWVLPAETGWISGDYGGGSAAINLSPLATIDIHGSLITAVDPVAGSWTFYSVDATDGTATELLKLSESQSTILATRSSDGSRLFFHSGEPGRDGGIDMIDVATGSRKTIVAGGEVPDQERRLLFWSASGKTLFSLLCGAHECAVDVIDEATAAVHQLPRQFGAIAASDRFALGYSSAEGPNRPWELYDLTTDTTKVIAKEWIGETEEGIAVGGDTFVVGGWSADHSAYNVVEVNGESGAQKVVWTQKSTEAVLRLQPYLTSDRWVALSAIPLWQTVLNGGASVTVLDLDSARLLPAVGAVAVK